MAWSKGYGTSGQFFRLFAEIVIAVLLLDTIAHSVSMTSARFAKLYTAAKGMKCSCGLSLKHKASGATSAANQISPKAITALNVL